MENTALLEIRSLYKYFGGLAAVIDLNFDVHQGEILGLIGPNGAGKTTLLNVIAGSLSPTKGKVIFGSKDITDLSPHRRAKLGIGRVFQGNILFQNFTVLTNALVGLYLHSKIRFGKISLNTVSIRSPGNKLCQRAMELLQLTGLTRHADELAINLPHGKKRLLGLTIALANEPNLLLLDEPVTGMNAEEVENMLTIIRAMRTERGITIIVVEHNMRAVMALCDRIYVLDHGIKIAEGTPKEIAENPAVIEAYLGIEEHVA